MDADSAINKEKASKRQGDLETLFLPTLKDSWQESVYCSSRSNSSVLRSRVKPHGQKTRYPLSIVQRVNSDRAQLP